jgi:hypothetical protein
MSSSITWSAWLLCSLFYSAYAVPVPQDGGSATVPDGGVGYTPSGGDGAVPGADGDDTGGVGLSKGAIIGISVVAAVVVIAGGTSPAHI